MDHREIARNLLYRASGNRPWRVTVPPLQGYVLVNTNNEQWMYDESKTTTQRGTDVVVSDGTDFDCVRSGDGFRCSPTAFPSEPRAGDGRARSGAHAQVTARRAHAEFTKNALVWYIDHNIRKASTVIAVHRDDIDPYYTIHIEGQDGEHQTDPDRLEQRVRVLYNGMLADIISEDRKTSLYTICLPDQSRQPVRGDLFVPLFPATVVFTQGDNQTQKGIVVEDDGRLLILHHGDDISLNDSIEYYANFHMQYKDFDNDLLETETSRLEKSAEPWTWNEVRWMRESPRRRLELNLRKYNCQIVEVPSDNNCQFHAVAKQLVLTGVITSDTIWTYAPDRADAIAKWLGDHPTFATESNRDVDLHNPLHTLLREQAVNWLQDNRETSLSGSTLEQFNPTNEAWSNYVNMYRSVGVTWGSALTLIALSAIYNVRIVPITNLFLAGSEPQCIQWPLLEDEDIKQLVIGHYAEFHYVSTKPLQQSVVDAEGKGTVGGEGEGLAGGGET